jgi:hypothetical protein
MLGGIQRRSGEVWECITSLMTPNKIGMIKSKRTRGTGNIARIAYKILVGKNVANKPRERCRPADHLAPVEVSSGQGNESSVSIKYRESLIS